MFKNDLLIQVLSDEPGNIITPFATKYGEGVRSTKMDSTTCMYDGKKEIRQNVKYVDQWDRGQIKAASVQQYYYDGVCHRQKEIYFHVYSQKELTKALACENQMRAKFSAAQEDAERKNLKDF